MSGNPFPTPIHGEGIHFGMCDADYHRDPSFSASGVKAMRVSAWHYWRTSRLNPNRVDDDTRAKLLGRAYHRWFLEGPDAFAASYAVSPSKADFPDAIDGAKALRAYALSLGSTKPGKSIEELCFSIRERDAVVELWPLIMADFEKTVGEREVLSGDESDEMTLGLYVLAHMPTVARAFTAGYPEVSLFWKDEKTGVPMKARFDYLRHSTIADLKTFTNKNRIDVDEAAIKALEYEGYNVQPPIYLDGLAAVAKLYKEHGDKVVHGDVDPAWMRRLMAQPTDRFTFVFLQKGGTPEIVPLEFCRSAVKGGSMNAYYAKGLVEYRKAVNKYVRCVADLGIDQPWIIDRGTRPLRDEDFSLRSLASEPDDEEVAA